MTKLGICNHEYEGDHTYTALCRDCEAKLYGEFAELEGSEKQVAWAQDIRQQQLKELAKALLKRGKIADMDQRGIAVAQKLAGIKDAKFWIDNRTAGTNELLKAGMQA